MITRTLLLFFLSGATSLVYEVIWMRRLSLVFGHSIFSVSTVLTTFMAGLALGSYYGGRWSDRQREKGAAPKTFLNAYGKLELFIGLWAVLSLGLLNVVEWGFLTLSRTGLYGFALVPLLFVCSFLVLLPPTTAMGASLPVFTQALVWHKDETGSFLSKIYGLNTLGACCGAATGGLIALPMLGLVKTILVTAFLNAVIALLARSLGSKLSPLSAEPTEESPSSTAVEKPVPLEVLPVPPSGTSLVPFVFALSGFAGMVYQLGWTRALVLSIGSSTYSFSIILTTFLASLGLGSFLYRNLFQKRAPRLADLALLQLLIGATALIVTLGIGQLPVFKIYTLPKLIGSFARVAAFDTLTVFLLLLVPTLALGLTFPLVTHLFTSSLEQLGKKLGEAYASNTSGAILGSFFGGFVLIPVLGVQNSIKLSAFLNLLGGVLLLWKGPALRRLEKKIAAVLITATVGLLLLPVQWNLSLLSAGAGLSPLQSEIIVPPIFFRDGMTSTVTVHLNFGTFPYLKVNGKTDASIAVVDSPTQLLLGMVPAALHPEPKSVAVIGFGSGQTLVGLLSVPGVEKVQCAELEPAVLEASKYFEPFSEGAFDDPRLTLIEDDGRSFILGSSEKFDIIVSEPSNPWIAGIGGLFTLDFYRGCQRQLNEGGVMAQWFHIYSMSESDIQMVYRTFFQVFPNGALYQTSPGDILLIGTQKPSHFQPERLQELFGQEADSWPWFASLGLIDSRMLYGTFLADRKEIIEYLNRRGPGFEKGPINTDDRPLLEFRAPLNLYSDRGNAEDSTSHFLSAVPPEVSDQADIVQAGAICKILLSLRRHPEAIFQHLESIDPERKLWNPALLSPMFAQKPVPFTEIISAAPKPDKAWLTRLAIVWKMRIKDFTDLAALFDSALQQTDTSRARYWLLMGAAEEAVRTEDLDKARELYTEAIPLTKGSQPVFERGHLGGVDTWDEADLRKSLEINPNNGHARYLLALVLARQERYPEALEQASESFRLFPLNSGVARLLVDLYRRQGNADKVLHYMEKAREIENQMDATKT